MKLALIPAKKCKLSSELQRVLARAGSGLYSGREDNMTRENKQLLDDVIFETATRVNLVVISNADHLARLDYQFNNFCDFEFERKNFFRIVLHSELKLPLVEDPVYTQKIIDEKNEYELNTSDKNTNVIRISKPERRFIEQVSIRDYISHLERINEVRETMQAAGIVLPSIIERYSNDPNFVATHQSGVFCYQSEYFYLDKPEDIISDIKTLISEIGWINGKYARLKKFDPSQSKETVHTY